MRVMSSPSKTMLPDDEGSVPARTASSVDLPAPFGPIRPVIRPGITSIETPSTACMPSKCRWMSRAVRIGSLTGTFSQHPSRFVRGRRRAGKDAPRLGNHSLGPEPQEAEDQEADADPFERRNEIRRADVQPPK